MSPKAIYLLFIHMTIYTTRYRKLTETSLNVLCSPHPPARPALSRQGQSTVCCVCVVEPQPVSGGVVVPPPVSGLRHVAAPIPVAPSQQSPALQPGQNICADCERLIM